MSFQYHVRPNLLQIPFYTMKYINYLSRFRFFSTNMNYFDHHERVNSI